MDAAKALGITAIGLLIKGAQDNGMYGRMMRLTGQAMFALGRAGSKTFIEPELNQQWLIASGDMERDGLLQTPLRDMVVEFKFTRSEHFESIFVESSSLLLFKAALEYFDLMKNKRTERDRIACMSLGMAFYLIGESRYSFDTRSLEECLAQKSANQKFIRTQDDFMNFVSLTAAFLDLQKELALETDISISSFLSKLGTTAMKETVAE